MLSRFDFFKLETDHLFLLGGGGGADFFQQLKLDFFIDKVKVFFVIQLSTIAIRPIHLFNFSFIK